MLLQGRIPRGPNVFHDKTFAACSPYPMKLRQNFLLPEAASGRPITVAKTYQKLMEHLAGKLRSIW
jgi:hypothetical protein